MGFIYVEEIITRTPKIMKIGAIIIGNILIPFKPLFLNATPISCNEKPNKKNEEIIFNFGLDFLA